MSSIRATVKGGAHKSVFVHVFAPCTDKNGIVGATPRLSPRATSRRGMMLVVILVIVAVLAVLGSSFSFFMMSQLASVNAKQESQQARWAAESGVDRVIALLRDKRNDMDEWYNNPRAFRRILVWAPDKIGGSESLADQEPVPGRPAWRFSIVSYKVEGDNAKIRYGVTDEAGKININVASRMQLLALFDQLTLDNVTSEELADALIDWRDKDDEAITVNGAESSYYSTLNPPYKAKNKPLETVEELLMVKGFDGLIIYGEDFNRNGYLDANEDDGPEGSFPPDNGDGILERGLLPYVTVYSWDWNLGNDNKRRLDLNRTNFEQVDKLPQHIVTDVSPAVLEFIAQAQKRGYKFKSVGELVGLQVFEDGTSNYDKAWRRFARKLQQAGKVRQTSDDEKDQQLDEAEEEGGNSAGNQNDGGGSADQGQSRTGRRRTARDRNNQGKDKSKDEDPDNSNQGGPNQGGNQNPGGPNEDDEKDPKVGGPKSGGANKSIRSNKAGDEEEEDEQGKDNTSRDGGGGRGGNQNSNQASDDKEGSQDSGGSGNRRGGRDRNRGGSGSGSGNQNGGSDSKDGNNQNGDGDGDSKDGGRNQNDDGKKDGKGKDSQGQGKQPKDPDELDEEDDAGGEKAATGGGGKSKGTPITSPVTAQDLSVLMDRFTTNALPAMAGLINVNTASPIVLQTVPGLDAEMADAIVAKRTQLSGQDKTTPAWLISSGAVDPMTFAILSNQLTSRSIQFTIDAIGFADHVGAVKRLQVVVEMRGQLSQIKYYRDISSLGWGYPIKDDERSEGFAFSD